MLTYNTQQKKLALPEYGRNIQRMVDHTLTIEDRAERTAAAYAVVNTMLQMFPAEGDPEEYTRKLWDHLAIMADFKLGIDWPYEPIKPDDLHTTPEPIPLFKDPVQYSHYGRNLVSMLYACADMPEGEEREALALLLANQMKKTLLLANPDSADDERVKKDIYNITKGRVVIAPEAQLCDYKALPAPSGKKKKKK